ncbi:succinyl-CoA:3-ketoacid-coenzyme A transferase subunit A [Streptomyces sp. SPB78]|nr:succinyl-CoA:3-ketoacid-coenzyme A transferase subunit A [Streptomyces sp. SPB78]
MDGGGLGILLAAGRIARVTGSYVGDNKEFARQYLSGELELELTPQGTLAERLRAGGAGIPGFYTPAGVGTLVAEGGLPWRYAPDGSVALPSPPKEVRAFHGRDYLLEEAITTDFALVRAARGDRHGNLVFRKAARNFNPLAAMAGRTTVAEVEELVEPGALDPDEVHLPGVYVRRVLHKQKTHRPRPRASRREGCVPDGSPPYGDGRPRGPRTARRRIRQPRHRAADPHPRPPPGGRPRRPPVGERHPRRRPLPVRPRGRPRPRQRGQGNRHDRAGRLLLRLRPLLRHDPRRADRRRGARRHAGLRRGRPRQLGGAGEDDQGHGRRDGPRARLGARPRPHGAHDPRRLPETPRRLHPPADGQGLRRPRRHGPRDRRRHPGGAPPRRDGPRRHTRGDPGPHRHRPPGRRRPRDRDAMTPSTPTPPPREQPR